MDCGVSGSPRIFPKTKDQIPKTFSLIAWSTGCLSFQKLLTFWGKLCYNLADSAEVAEQADAHDSKSCSLGSVGSIPTFGTQRPAGEAGFWFKAGDRG